MNKFYGIAKQTILQQAGEKHLEELNILGFSILENVLEENDLNSARAKLDSVYKQQEEELKNEIDLSEIQEANLARLPLAYDDFFLSLAINEKLISLIQQILGNYFILHLQNGVINKPQIEHHQSSWHRDLPHQDFVISKPIAISALYCIDDFNENTGATFVLPFSHRLESMPSVEFIERHAIQINAKKGSVILMNAMLFHRAGYNKSQNIRRGINHIFTSAILKQQINIPGMLQGKFNTTPFLSMLLGYENEIPQSVIDFRKRRKSKLKK
jgi:ectoine hydroxylase-related dioxygenase (phytanoyl-CoA dioxygenase family)